MSRVLGTKVFLLGCIFLSLLFGYSFFSEYLFHHEYYYTMLASPANRTIILSGLIFAMIPACYVMFSKKIRFWGVVSSFITGLFFFSLTSVAVKGDLFGFAAYLKLLINILVVYGLIIFFLVALTTLGGRVKEEFLKLKTTSMYGVMFSAGIGLVLFLLVLYILLVTKTLYAGVSWALLLALGWLIYERRNTLSAYGNIIQDMRERYVRTTFHHGWLVIVALPFLGYMYQIIIGGGNIAYLYALIGVLLLIYYVYVSSKKSDWGFQWLGTKKGLYGLFLFFLLLLTVWYLYNCFILGFMPYPTAWDANHAYLFYPKMWALNNGYYWDVQSMLTPPRLWLAYITYWFSLFVGFGGFLGVSADTFAIEMNSISGLFVLLFGIVLVSSLLRFVRTYTTTEDDDTKHNSEIAIPDFLVLIGWFLLLQWLMSGMGMFLIVIDNKTDLGVLTLIILALYSGLTFLQKINESKSNWLDTRLYIGLSGLFYAVAVMAKPTAMFDVLNFFLFLRGLWIGTLGTLGIVLVVLGLLLVANFRGITAYLPVSIAPWLAGIGALGNIGNIVLRKMKKLQRVGVYLAIWLGSFVTVLLLLKAPVDIANMIVRGAELTPSTIVKRVFLSQNNGEQRLIPSHELFAQAENTSLPIAQCSLQTQGLTTETLYDGLENSAGSAYDEDVGRYVGFGWKGNDGDKRRGVTAFINPWRGVFLRPGCYAFNPLGLGGNDAKLLCEKREDWKKLDVTAFQSLENGLRPNSEASRIVSLVLQDLTAGTPASTVQENRATELRELDAIMQGSSILVVKDEWKEVYVPYRFLTFFNISFNWSLQNLSSYYTDIGVIWLFLLGFIVVGFLYGLVRRKQLVMVISLVTIFGRLLWMFIGGGILWYAIGIIVWSILSFIVFLQSLYDDIKDHENSPAHTYLGCFIAIFVLIGLIQMTMNLGRIASQGGQGAFMWYKTNVGVKETFDAGGNRIALPESGFVSEDVFNLQFPHYRKIIALANEREKDEGLFIAGTYLRYFIRDQHHVMYDQFLKWLWRMGSDGDMCNMYLRLQDQHIDYIVIDPNIGTVVQGEGNKTLFDRFFAEIGADHKSIVSDGTITMLVKLVQGGYLRFVSSNNIGSKYAFILPDSAFQGVSGDELVLLRGKMAVARFFSNSGQIIQSIKSVADQRIADGTFITDIADAYGLVLRDNFMINVARKPQPTAQDLLDMTQDERKAYSQYWSIKNMSQAQRDQTIISLISQTIAAGNQMIVLEVVD